MGGLVASARQAAARSVKVRRGASVSLARHACVDAGSKGLCLLDASGRAVVWRIRTSINKESVAAAPEPGSLHDWVRKPLITFSSAKTLRHRSVSEHTSFDWRRRGGFCYMPPLPGPSQIDMDRFLYLLRVHYVVIEAVGSVANARAPRHFTACLPDVIWLGGCGGSCAKPGFHQGKKSNMPGRAGMKSILAIRFISSLLLSRFPDEPSSFASNGTPEIEAANHHTLYARNFLMSKILCAMAKQACSASIRACPFTQTAFLHKSPSGLPDFYCLDLTAR